MPGMTRPADSVSLPARALGAAGLSGLLVITLASPGATRMYSWPWSLAYAATLLAPTLLLVWRTLNPRLPFTLPSRTWSGTALVLATVVLAAALASPWRGPSLQWSAPLLAAVAVFFLVFDWLHAGPAPAADRRAWLLTAAGLFFFAVALTSIGLWLVDLTGHAGATGWTLRNTYPLGHPNYTAGLALLMLPLFVALALRDHGTRRAGWCVAIGLALTMLLTSGSRGGFFGLGVLVVFHVPALARALKWKLWVVSVAVIIAFVAVSGWNPRTRTLLIGGAARVTLSESDEQRSAMIHAGLSMGFTRPLLGWGPGTTPLAYPHFRHELSGGVENVLQLHNLPVQIWAELGAAGLLTVLALIFLAVRAALAEPGTRTVLLALLGYAAFSLADWQLDVPVFAFALAAATALLAPTRSNGPAGRNVLGTCTLATLALVSLLGHRDPTPELNVRALTLGRDPATADRAIALFNESLALNPEQEIAHFNLGWLLVVRDPAAAEKHFLAAAHLVPDKGGVYFGLGLAHLNQGHRDGAVRAFAVECVNDPVFLVSPWWRDPTVGAIRPTVLMLMPQLLQEAKSHRLMEDRAADPEADYLLALLPWLGGASAPGEMLARARTTERAAYFARRPSPPDFSSAAVRSYRRERRGYPVLMRNPDLPEPVDLFDVQENTLATGEFRFLFPRKGWLPTPLLLLLLEDRKL